MSGRRQVSASSHENDDQYGVNPINDDRGVDHEPNVFDIRNALEPPNVRLYTTLDLNSEHRNSVGIGRYDAPHLTMFAVLIHNGHIDLDPPYQQGMISTFPQLSLY